MSIQTQKTMLAQYAKDNGLENFRYFVDDGVSGTTFERSGFKQITSEIEAGKVDTVIVKDLSRLGREYLQMGYYCCWSDRTFGFGRVGINPLVRRVIRRTTNADHSALSVNVLPLQAEHFASAEARVQYHCEE